ncbi:MAG: UDP-N-acetylmuramoyl-L-alanine--D-glutamate ligase [Candidatus Nanopelagicaceae bacterium]|nr:UDP-N-acetylmuramoyl-L-alanine--D-glutamate ligase [Candidatus Nanopelagicaceae bacterium]
MRKVDIAQARVLVIGAGVTGSSVAQVLHGLGSEVRIFDDNQRVNADERFISLESALAGGWSFAVVSPGWRRDHPLIARLMSQGTRVLSEIDLAWLLRCELQPSQTWLAVTGTNGKTTTVEMATAMLLAGGLKAKACGNVGETVIEAVINGDRMDYLVLELSSFQLQWSELPEFKSVAILNIADDHTDWHGSFENYVAAKMRILDKADLAILNGDDSKIVEGVGKWEGRKVFFSLNAPKPGELGVVENLLVDRSFVLDTNEAELIAQLDEVHPCAPHSISNTLAAAGLARSVGVSHQVIRQTVHNFLPGRHRIETVMESDGITWVNDSKATNPHAAAASLASYPSIVWIAGGLAKGASMNELVKRSVGHIKAVILIGQDRELIANALMEEAPGIPYLRIDKDPTEGETLMEHVVIEAKKIAKAGDAVLLAPACASMDQFISYADRGDQFTAAVKKLVGSK